MLERKATWKAKNVCMEQVKKTYTNKRIRLIGFSLGRVNFARGPVFPEHSLSHFTYPTKRRFSPNNAIFFENRRRTIASHLPFT